PHAGTEERPQNRAISEQLEPRRTVLVGWQRQLVGELDDLVQAMIDPRRPIGRAAHDLLESGFQLLESGAVRADVPSKQVAEKGSRASNVRLQRRPPLLAVRSNQPGVK